MSSYTIIICIVGAHAGQELHKILDHKFKDIDMVGSTSWVVDSYTAKQGIISDFCKSNKNPTIYFIEAGFKTGASPTKYKHINLTFLLTKNRGNTSLVDYLK